MKYKFTGEAKAWCGVILHRIVAEEDNDNFGIKKGDLGGWIEKKENLSDTGNAWVYGDAGVCGNAEVYGDARVCGNAWVYGDARVCGDARVYGNAEVYGDAEVCGDARVCGNAKITSVSDYMVFKNWWSSGRYFTWTRSNNKWSVGCFHGTGEELVKNAYKDSKKSGREYERVVKYVESILKEENGNERGE